MENNNKQRWRVGEILVKTGCVTWENLQQALEIQKQLEAEIQSAHANRSLKSVVPLNLGEILVKNGWLNWVNLEIALNDQKSNTKVLGEILLEKGFITKESLFRALAVQASLGYVDLKKIKIAAPVISLVPKHFVLEYRAMPVVVHEHRLMLAISDPQNVEPEERLQVLLPDYKVEPVLSLPEDIEQAIHFYYGASS